MEICPIWSHRSIPAPRAMHGTLWMVSKMSPRWQQTKGLLGDQQCVRPGPPLQPQAAVFISTCQCSHINPIYFRTGMTQVSFLQTLWQQQISTTNISTGTQKIFTWNWSKQMLSQGKESPLGHKPCILGRNKVKGVGRSSGISLANKNQTVSLHLYEPPNMIKFKETESRTEVTRGRR